MTESVLVSLGSNIEPLASLPAAFGVLADRVEIVAASRIYESDAVAERPMPVFLNAAVEVSTDVEPADFKYELLRPIEAELGRRRTRDRNAPRTIDLDIALFGDRVVSDAEVGIEIPDPDIVRFAHVALPLADLAPGRLHPTDGRTLAEIAREVRAGVDIRLSDHSLELIDWIARRQSPKEGREDHCVR